MPSKLRRSLSKLSPRHHKKRFSHNQQLETDAQEDGPTENDALLLEKDERLQDDNMAFTNQPMVLLSPSSGLGHRKTHSDASSMPATDGSGSQHSRSSSPKGSIRSIDRKSSQSTADNLSTSMSKVASAGRSLKNFLSTSYRSRNDQFRKLFKNVPESDRFVMDYSCAFQREILVHGRMFLSQARVCFYANIFKWETCLNIQFKDIKAITKERTAMVIPNAIQLTNNNGEKYFFCSFTRRDKAYMMMFKLWQYSLLDKTVSPAEMWSWAQHGYDEAELSDSDRDVLEELERQDDTSSLPTEPSPTWNEDQSPPSMGALPSPGLSDTSELSKTSSTPEHGSVSLHSPTVASFSKRKRSKDTRKRTLPPVQSSPAIVNTAPDEMSSDSSDNETELFCPCTEHQGQELLNAVYPMSVDQLFILIYSDNQWFRDFEVTRKVTNLEISPWEIDEQRGTKHRLFKYTMALNQSVGPKSCDCVEKQTCVQHGKSGQIYVISSEIKNQNVPYCDSFLVLTTVCMSRVAPNESRLRVHGHIHYVKSVWGMIKGMIEKNTIAGLKEYYSCLDIALMREVARLGIPAEAPPEIAPVAPGIKRPRPSRRSPEHASADSSPERPLIPKEVEWIAKIMILVMLVMLLLNGALFLKLWSMDSAPKVAGTYSIDDLALFLKSSNPDDLIRLHRLQRQQAAMESIGATLRTLNQMEAQLNDLKIQFQSAQQIMKDLEVDNCDATRT